MDTLFEIIGYFFLAVLCVGLIFVAVQLLPFILGFAFLVAPLILWLLGFFEDWSSAATFGACFFIPSVGVGLAVRLDGFLNRLLRSSGES